MLIKLTFECTKKIFLHCWKLKRFITKISVQLLQPANRLITNPRQPVFTTASSWIEIISFPTTITTTFIAVKPDGPPGAKCKDTVAYWFLQSFTNVLRICRSMRLQTRSSAAPVRYLGHTPITARQKWALQGKYLYGIQPFLWILFCSYFETDPWQGLGATSRGSGERWQLGWLGLKVDLSSLYANALAPRQSCVGDALSGELRPFFFPLLFKMTSPFIQARWHHWESMFWKSHTVDLTVYTFAPCTFVLLFKTISPSYLRVVTAWLKPDSHSPKKQIHKSVPHAETQCEFFLQEAEECCQPHFTSPREALGE